MHINNTCYKYGGRASILDPPYYVHIYFLIKFSIEAFAIILLKKGIQPIEDMIAEDDSNYEDISEERNDTLSTAPTVLMGFNESEDRMLDVRTPSHIPGKRRAPKRPPAIPKSPPPVAPSTPTR